VNGAAFLFASTLAERPGFADSSAMKSSYELAMERLNHAAPTVKLTDEQKRDLAEIESGYAAKLAERELLVADELKKAREKGDLLEIEQLQKQILSDRKSIEAEKESKKETVRSRKN